MGNSEIEAVKSKTSDQKDLDLEAALCCFFLTLKKSFQNRFHNTFH